MFFVQNMFTDKLIWYGNMIHMFQRLSIICSQNNHIIITFDSKSWIKLFYSYPSLTHPSLFITIINSFPLSPPKRRWKDYMIKRKQKET